MLSGASAPDTALHELPQWHQAKCEISSKTHIFWKPTVRKVNFAFPNSGPIFTACSYWSSNALSYWIFVPLSYWFPLSIVH
ncbi:hypothetical protein T03_15199 [Trichinella britovi]|uniref:Uncharacterized protein n=1 Tax=Trichinella britovi TaxID=45882 RepID=A0A0V1D0T8_TRIBR|nr:hypothetical protein T03_15199 [Trichinella britovi]